jgi:AraC family transcriptional regulator
MTLETPRENRSEAGFWRSVRGTWRQVYGDFQRSGVSIEWHDFETSKSLDWSRSFHEDSLEICLNLAGDANITHRRKNYRLETHFVGVYRPLGNHIFAERHPGVRHQFVTIELARDFLANRLSEIEPKHLHPIAQSFLEYRTNKEPMAETRPMTVAQQTLSTVLKEPPVPEAARPLWFEAKTLEVLSQILFLEDDKNEMFCTRQKRVSRERVERVKAILARDLENSPTLEQLGREVGCSSFYLSRLFSQEVGLTVPQYLRKLRMEKAGQLLLTGRYNVSEAAIEVGYNSLSHFSRAFCQTMGVCPALYASVKLAKRKGTAKREEGRAKSGLSGLFS